MTSSDGSPGSHSHIDRPNWQPATTFEDYLRNCREGIETYSERRHAQLLGVPRIELYRWKRMAELPEELFERLLAAGVRSNKGLDAIALALRRDDPLAHDAEHCPHCGRVLRRRRHVGRKALKAVSEWATKEEPPNG
jgi:hypothetical protein